MVYSIVRTMIPYFRHDMDFRSTSGYSKHPSYCVTFHRPSK